MLAFYIKTEQAYPPLPPPPPPAIHQLVVLLLQVELPPLPDLPKTWTRYHFLFSIVKEPLLVIAWRKRHFSGGLLLPPAFFTRIASPILDFSPFYTICALPILIVRSYFNNDDPGCTDAASAAIFPRVKRGYTTAASTASIYNGRIA